MIRAMLLLLLTMLLLPLAHSMRFDYPTANPGTKWINNNTSLPHSIAYTDGSLIRAVLLESPSPGTHYAFGFFCTDPSSFSPCQTNSYLLAVCIVQTNSGGGIVMPNAGFPRAVWYANRQHPVRENAILTFNLFGDLSLLDSDGTLVWSTNITSQKRVHTLSLQSMGNLVLANAQSHQVWQSFDHPVDILVLGQQLRSGTTARLTSNTYLNNSTRGHYYMEMGRAELGLYAEDPITPQLYWSLQPFPTPTKTISAPYAQYRNGSLDLFISNRSYPDKSIAIPSTPHGSLSYLQLGPDGKIRIYSWLGSDSKWTMLVDLQAGSKKRCSIPSICGPYGICYNGQCSCLQASSANGSKPDDAFIPIVSLIPSLGCIPKPDQLACNTLNPAANQHFLRQENFYYPNVLSLPSYSDSMSVEECEQRCMHNCSCKAALFQLMYPKKSLGICFTVSKLYTLTPNAQISIHWKSLALIKMQNALTLQ